jgi:hypothetical protein
MDFARTQYVDLIRAAALRHRKMAFITGPRQVGKTTLARQLLPEDGVYYTWDDVEFRRQWIRDPKVLISQPAGRRLTVVLDELHKAPRWKSYLKGVYDTRGDFADIIVTGSTRLDVSRRGGDSLLGRYFTFRLHPFSVGELARQGEVPDPDTLLPALRHPLSAPAEVLKVLQERGGFPEPYLKGQPAFLNLWRRTRTERLVREDLLDISRTHELALLETLAALLPERVGSLLSMQSLVRDLEVGHPTIRRWLSWLSQLYYVFLVPPYGRNIARALKKQPKLYLVDWAEVRDPAARFENLVAGHLLKAAHFWTDAGFGAFELRYVRDKEKREVDFLLLRDQKPCLLIECKLADAKPSPHLAAFSSALSPALCVQVIGKTGVHEWFDLPARGKGLLISADAFLAQLP